MKNRCINWSGGHHFLGSHTRISIVCLLLVCFALVGCIDESHLDLPGYGVFKPQIELEEDTKELSFESNDFEVELSANVDYEVEVTDVDWIVVNSQPEEKKCHFHIPQNESRKVRQAKIIFSSKLFGVSDTLLILQGGDPNFIKVGEPIDLGLSVKWASWNVGAELPEDYGGYYAWGEIEEKALYYWSNYKFYDENTEKFTKYSILYGGDNKTYLDLEDDVAHVKWGDEWRMPTVSEFKELVDNCTYEYVSVNGVYGYKMTGPNGNSIFLPNPPCRMYDVLEGPGYGAGCNYRSSTLETDSYGSAYSIHFGGNNTFRHSCERFMGVAVRPVYGPGKSRITITTGDVSGISSDSVVCSGTVGGTDTEMECGIIYGTSTELGGMFDGTKVPTTSTGDFSVALKDLEPNSTYYYRAYVYIPKEHLRYEYGEIKSFTTKQEITVTTGTATDITYNSATLSGTINNAEASLDCGFIYGTSSDLSATKGTLVSTKSEEEFSVSINELASENTYYYRAYVIVDGEYVYGEVLSFETEQGVSVTTGDATDITYNSVVLSGTINNFSASLNCGFIYGTSSDLSATKGTLVSANSKKDFSLTINGLSDFTLYYYRSYVIVDGEYIYGEVKSFRTKREIRITTGSATDITLSSATLRGRIGNAESSLTCGFVYGTSSDLSATNGTLVSTQSDKEFSIIINGLSSNTTYYYCAYVIVDDEYKYGKVLSFTTEQAIALTTYKATDITGTSATLNGGVDNSEVPLTCGFIYGTSSDLSLTKGTIVSTQSNERFSLSINGLTPFTTYYYRTYAIVDNKYIYGEVVSFIAKSEITVTTGDAINITSNSVTLCGTVNDANEALECGFVLNGFSVTDANATVVKTKSANDFKCSISDLSSRDYNYYFAYVKVGSEYRYGEIRHFNNSVSAVDLGLSVKWAPCNVGARNPWNYGDYYAWGETEVKSDYTWATYKWCNGSNQSLTKYCKTSTWGIVDNKTILEPEDDVAHMKWGGAWRMPTADELKELLEKCSWTMTTLEGVSGFYVTGPNGNSIFIPAAGYYRGIEHFGNTINLWSNTLDSSNSANCFLYESRGVYHMYVQERTYGISVRPVMDK